MSESSVDSHAETHLELTRQIDHICDQFETDFNIGSSPRIEAFLHLVTAVARPKLLRELIAIDADLQGLDEHSESWSPYYERFPGETALIDIVRLERKTAAQEEVANPARRAAPSIGDEVDHFQLLAIAGKGGFGTVWRAWDKHLQRDVALKIPHPAMFSKRDADLILREARILAKLRHPNIVPIYEIGEQPGQATWYIVSELIDGVNLGKWMETFDKSPRIAATLVLKIAKALAHAHEQNIFHRDLKPANILIDKAGEPLLTDFGLAKQGIGEDLFSSDGYLVGTIPYMSPEQIRGIQSQVDQRTDIYGLGVVAYELLTGRPPFRGDRNQLQRQIAQDPLPTPRRLNSRIPRDLENICLKCLEKEPSRRFQDIQDLVRNLEHFLADKPLEGVIVPKTTELRKWTRRNRSSIIGIGATAILYASLAVALWIWNTPPSTLRLVEFTTQPPGCEITVAKIDETTGDPDPGRIQHANGRTPLTMWLEPGHYLVVAVQDELHFHEVPRHVPATNDDTPLGFDHSVSIIRPNGTVTLPTIHIPQSDLIRDMGFVPGTERLELPNARREQRPLHWRMPGFHVDLGEEDAESLRTPDDPQHLIASWKAQPAVVLGFALARSRAEISGKRLPTAAELYYLSNVVCPPPGATGRTNTGDVPALDRLPDKTPIRDLHSGLWEWTSTRRGGAFTGAGPSSKDNKYDQLRVAGSGDGANYQDHSGIGLIPFRETGVIQPTGARFVRSPKPRRQASDFVVPERPVQPH